MHPGFIKLVLVSHAVSAAVLTGALTHLSLVLFQGRKGRHNPRLLKLYPTVGLWAYASTLCLGAVMYPHYRVHVRAEHLDLHSPRLSILFDIKENVAVLVFPLLLATWLSTRAPRALPGEVATASGWICALAVWFNVISGLLVTSVRGV